MTATHSCWTCKGRKIGCDKDLPSCRNCTQTNRTCLGYGVRLTWPDQPDGRRKSAFHVASSSVTGLRVVRVEYNCRHFLNFTFDDLAYERQRGTRRFSTRNSLAKPRCSLALHIPLYGQDAMLMSYYERVISSMCSTTKARNGFCSEILPMALSSRDDSSIALCNALLAISAHHRLGSKAAVPYKITALSNLSRSLSAHPVRCPVEVTEVQLAACMMLCMYSVFDEAEGNWHLHLDGARMLLQELCRSQRRRLPSKFLTNWFIYYDILGDFTQPSRHHRENSDLLSRLQLPQSDTAVIIGSLGCSLDVFAIIHHINQLRILPVQAEAEAEESDKRVQQRMDLENRLRTLAQQLDPDEASLSAPLAQAYAMATADLYRLAALLYVQRVCPLDGDQARRASYLKEALDAVAVLPVTTSPWPIFVFACESQCEEQRIVLLDALDKMDKMRSVGNVPSMRTVIETIWKQDDLQGRANQGPEWWQFVDSHVAVPWFV